MSNFENRVSDKINRRVLNIFNIERDNITGEITKMEVDMERGDNESVDTIGTQLTAENLAIIVDERITELFNNNSNNNENTSNEFDRNKAEFIVNNLEVPTSATYTFNLPEEDIIEWSINDLNVDCITLEGNTVTFLSVTEDITINFKALCRINQAVATKVFPILLKFEENIITQSSNFIEWDQTASTQNRTIFAINSSKEPLYLEVLGDNTLFDIRIKNNNSMAVRVEIYELEKLKNGKKVNISEDFTLNVNVYLDSDHTNVLENRTYTIRYKYREIGIINEEFNVEWIQEKGVYKYTDFTVMPETDDAIYVEVNDYNSNFLTLTSPYNLFGGNSIRFRLTEKKVLNDTNRTTPLVLNFLVKVFLDIDRSVIVKEIPGTIIYNFTSTDPID